MSHLEIRLPETIRLGMVGGPVFATEIVSLNSGWEKRNIGMADPLRRYRVEYVKGLDDLKRLHHFFMVVRGAGFSFRLKDWTDYTVEGTEGLIGTGVGTASTTYQLYKRYSFDGNTYDREIKKIVAGSYTVFKNGTPQSSPTDYTLNENTGVITWAVAPNGDTITWQGQFDTPARFTNDAFDIRVIQQGLYEVVDMQLKEVRV